MQRRIITAIFLVIACATNLWGSPQLSFSPEGKFRIVQFTDLHLMPESDLCASTEATIRQVVAEQKPQLAVLTGDVVTYSPPYKGWQQVADLFNDLKLPFVVMMGNHDGEYVVKREVYEFLIKASPWYAGTAGTAAGAGDCVIEIAGEDGNPSALIYCIDSNDYQSDKQLGAYDWIHFDQIEWYREQSRHYTMANGGKPLPALAFFHIPLVEFGEVVADPATYGHAHEGAGAPGGMNTGMFASFIEMGDVMGVFCGHDHDNDYVGITKRVALGFGRCTGAEAYGKLTRGGRMFELFENQFKFDTWVATPGAVEPAYYYPSGLNGLQEQTMTYLPSLPESRRGARGVDFDYHEGLIKATAQIDTTRLVKSGVMPNFSIDGAGIDDHFGYKFRTLIDIPERGVYKFYTYSDDGSVLRIDGVTVVDNDGGHSARRREGMVALEAGLHLLELDYFENYMGQTLEVGMSARNIPEAPIPSAILYRP